MDINFIFTDYKTPFIVNPYILFEEDKNINKYNSLKKNIKFPSVKNFYLFFIVKENFSTCIETEKLLKFIQNNPHKIKENANKIKYKLLWKANLKKFFQNKTLYDKLLKIPANKIEIFKNIFAQKEKQCKDFLKIEEINLKIVYEIKEIIEGYEKYKSYFFIKEINKGEKK